MGSAVRRESQINAMPTSVATAPSAIPTRNGVLIFIPTDSVHRCGPSVTPELSTGAAGRPFDVVILLDGFIVNLSLKPTALLDSLPRLATSEALPSALAETNPAVRAPTAAACIEETLESMAN